MIPLSRQCRFSRSLQLRNRPPSRRSLLPGSPGRGSAPTSKTRASSSHPNRSQLNRQRPPPNVSVFGLYLSWCYNLVLAQVPQYHTSRGPIFQPYPGPYHMMNPSYSMNGPPYGQHPQHPGPHGQTMNPSGPPPPQYGYPMPGPYAHAYPPYPQYPQPMMVYPPPRQEGPPEATHSEPPESVSAGTKRKRKSVAQSGREQGPERGSDEDTPGASTSDVSRPVVSQQAMQAPSADLKKRTKTVSTYAKVALTFLLTTHIQQRACDSCRSRKIRCDIIPNIVCISSVVLLLQGLTYLKDLPHCQHCKQYSFECTFFLPITETRFKKKKMEEDPDKEKVTAVAVTPDNSKVPASRDTKREIGVFGM